MTDDKRREAFDLQPNLGCETNEPSLRAILYEYYAPHFNYQKSMKLVDQYIAAWLESTAPETQAAAVGESACTACRGAGSIGEPPAPCPFCKLSRIPATQPPDPSRAGADRGEALTERELFDAWADEDLPSFQGGKQPTWGTVEENVRHFCAEAWMARAQLATPSEPDRRESSTQQAGGVE